MPKRPGTHKPSKQVAPVHDVVEIQRGNSNQRGYTYRWQKASKRFLAKHPFCVDCQELGFVVAATEVDHIIPHKGDDVLFWDESNWQPLCKPHHSAKTARENAGNTLPHGVIIDGGCTVLEQADKVGG